MQTSPACKPLLPLRVRSLCYANQSGNLLNNLTLDIKNAGITIILGHNGAGKSLLIRLLHGLLKSSQGSIDWNQQSPQDINVRLRQSMVFQKTVLLRRSVAANIDYVLALRHRRNKVHRNNILKRAGLETRSNQPARSLSGGEQQRLAIARALACEPEVLFLDEPTASLDPSATAHIERQVDQASRQSVKIIMITHDIAQARRLADDVIFMHSGSVSEHSSAEQFFTKPTSDAGRNYLNAYIAPSSGQTHV